MTQQPARILDLSGLLCPLPVLKARKVLLTMKPGEVLEVKATDPMSAIDMPHFCAAQGYTLQAQSVEGTTHIYRIVRT
jgi:tRNA 2-thiouridine synthesizing protein A